MTLRSEIQEKQYDAMKKGDAERLSIMRLLNSAIKNEEIELRRDLNDEEAQAVVGRQVKQLKDALKDFEAGGRKDLMDKTQKEIEILEEYLPEQMSDEKLEEIVGKIIEQMSAGPQDVGKVMGAVMKEVKGQADGNKVREIVSKKLN
ncbi:MAG: glutamyl-tRNA amidotransferase [Candidatus Magasanikbacteria bacterium RIFOXYC2_FULL_40_16]|uniref:Glutamyl-tRNA amidotransferase n=2 Tax=Candidatus Magasanikiibacteriota TaxID=1752731 RepID=A0A1F6NHM4_9BACT|nr:MAG: glutamyl-tRNA amidotransferase [Candidatus Magasanikbacteria bacterium RIFOXYB1_FULL_40_15]OGH85951.1 MAG: glutamyl-tRNA amidotransferase [Candidatus Magasanikbacteria bacterium RIFOXYB2_FULL_40_13]OGH89315.1 MAG: glutamyl-tRNA amidotransferase [Candidatus Magasanikbacteria bacterium RIFOXYC2_FULL_40_16]